MGSQLELQKIEFPNHMIGKSAINRFPPAPLDMEDPQLDQWFISYFLIAKWFFLKIGHRQSLMVDYHFAY